MQSSGMKYKDLIKLLVCIADYAVRCSNFSGLKEFDDEEGISFKHWESTNCAKLVTYLMLINDLRVTND